MYEYTRRFEYILVFFGIHQYQYLNRTAIFGSATRVSHFVDWIEELTAGEWMPIFYIFLVDIVQVLIKYK